MNLPPEINDFMFSILYSDGTPLDLKRQAHDLINHFSLTFESDPQSDGRLFSVSTPGGMKFLLNSAQYLSCKSQLDAGLKINAIKELRAITLWTLRDAKDAIDDESQWKQIV